MLLAGKYDLTIDPKNRLSIPFQVRSKLDPGDNVCSFYIVPGRLDGTLRLYAEGYFERFADDLHQSVLPGREQEEFETLFFGMATLMDQDKQGRVLLPQWLLEKVGIGKQVSLTGARDHLVLWNRDECQKFMDRNWARHADWLEQARQKGRPGPQNGEPT